MIIVSCWNFRRRPGISDKYPRDYEDVAVNFIVLITLSLKFFTNLSTTYCFYQYSPNLTAPLPSPPSCYIHFCRFLSLGTFSLSVEIHVHTELWKATEVGYLQNGRKTSLCQVGDALVKDQMEWHWTKYIRNCFLHFYLSRELNSSQIAIVFSLPVHVLYGILYCKGN